MQYVKVYCSRCTFSEVTLIHDLQSGALAPVVACHVTCILPAENPYNKSTMCYNTKMSNNKRRLYLPKFTVDIQVQS